MTANAASVVIAVEPGTPDVSTDGVATVAEVLASAVSVVAVAVKTLVAEAPSAKAWILLLEVDTDELLSAPPTLVNMAGSTLVAPV